MKSKFNQPMIKDPKKRRALEQEKRNLWKLEKEIAEKSGMPTNLYDEYCKSENDDMMYGNGGRWRKRPCDIEDNPLFMEEIDYGQTTT